MINIVVEQLNTATLSGDSRDPVSDSFGWNLSLTPRLSRSERRYSVEPIAFGTTGCTTCNVSRHLNNSISMPLIPVESLDDPRLTPYRHLKRMNPTRWSNVFIAEGVRLVERLLESDFEVVSILAAETHLRRLPDDVIDSVPVFAAPLKMLEQVVGFQFHSGMLACGRRPAGVALEEWMPPVNQPALLVGCPETTDPDNLGTIMRISAAFGAAGLLVGSASADPFSRRTLRISMGNAFFLPIHQTFDFTTDLVRARDEFGFTVIASLLGPETIPLSQCKRPSRLLLLLGNEDHGLSPELAALADRRVTIPMADKVDSLNVGIAAGIFLHHLTMVADAENE